MRDGTDLQRLFAYDDWANREALASLRAASSPPPRAQKFLAHILAAESLWLARLKQETRQVVVWPDLSLVECARQIDELRGAWDDYLGALTPATVEESVHYTNTKGERWTNRVEDILLHVVMHSVYHRGQIATEVRAAGFTPAYTDFIQAVRSGKLTTDD
jgi:uncharacterized damage-inducible protein DinB